MQNSQYISQMLASPKSTERLRNYLVTAFGIRQISLGLFADRDVLCKFESQEIPQAERTSAQMTASISDSIRVILICDVSCALNIRKSIGDADLVRIAAHPVPRYDTLLYYYGSADGLEKEMIPYAGAYTVLKNDRL